MTEQEFWETIKALRARIMGLERENRELKEQNKRYQKAIKECVERMNAGGAGTRSFVYEKLIEVLEGESNELG